MFFYNFLQFLFNFPLKVLIFIVFFTLPLERRRRFWLYAPVLGCVYLAAFYFIPLVGYAYSIVVFLLALLWILGCFKCSLYTALFCVVGAFTSQHVAMYAFDILQILLHIQANDMTGLVVSMLLCIAVAVGTYFIYVRRVDYTTLKRSKSMLVNSLVIVTFNVICDGLLSQNNNTRIFFYVYAIISCVLTLNLQYSIFLYRELELKNEEIAKIMYAERRQQKISRQSIEMLNMRCHDLKRQMELLAHAGKQEYSEIINGLKETIEEYDSVIQTGFDALDTVLTKKNFECKRKNIIFSYIADGKVLSFMSDADVYSLFCNALENAIEAVSDVEKEKQIISLSITENHGYAHIHLENYCGRTLSFKDGLPQTTKVGELHGYGTRSIKYIAQKYHGHINMATRDQWFVLDVFLPIP